MADFSLFENLPEKNKFEYLWDWCDRMARAVDQLRSENQGLHERLRQAEEKLAGKS
ncbi:MAG TPA: hypothetical protein VLV50_20375 [Stellaceae bacterium]|nr:hypothetical protein [Stellaceae bacterium]